MKNEQIKMRKGEQVKAMNIKVHIVVLKRNYNFFKNLSQHYWSFTRHKLKAGKETRSHFWIVIFAYFQITVFQNQQNERTKGRMEKMRKWKWLVIPLTMLLLPSQIFCLFLATLESFWNTFNWVFRHKV